MTVKDLYTISPRSFLFIEDADTLEKREYSGGRQYADARVLSVEACSWPMFKSVLLIHIKGGLSGEVSE